MLDDGMYDGLFSRTDLISLMTLLTGAQDIQLHLQRSGWPNTIHAKFHSLQVTIKIQPYEAWGTHRINLPAHRVAQLADQLAAMSTDIVSVHLEGPNITIASHG